MIRDNTAMAKVASNHSPAQNKTSQHPHTQNLRHAPHTHTHTQINIPRRPAHAHTHALRHTGGCRCGSAFACTRALTAASLASPQATVRGSSPNWLKAFGSNWMFPSPLVRAVTMGAPYFPLRGASNNRVLRAGCAMGRSVEGWEDRRVGRVG